MTSIQPSLLDPIFAARSIAVIGASDRLNSVEGGVYSNLCQSPFAGPVYAVNHHHAAVQQQQAYSSIRQRPTVPDLTVICTAAPGIPDLVRECGELGVPGLIVISAGFRESGTTGREL